MRGHRGGGGNARTRAALHDIAINMVAIRYDSRMYFEGALLMMMFGFISSVALAKFLLLRS